jgi:hypothetical protein
MSNEVSDKIYNMATEGANLRIKMPDYLREQYKTYSSGLPPESFSKSKDKMKYIKNLAEFTGTMKKKYPDYFRKVVVEKGVIKY